MACSGSPRTDSRALEQREQPHALTWFPAVSGAGKRLTRLQALWGPSPSSHGFLSLVEHLSCVSPPLGKAHDGRKAWGTATGWRPLGIAVVFPF